MDTNTKINMRIMVRGQLVVCDIDEIMDMLDWNQSEEIQQKGIELASGIKYLNAFLQPMRPGKRVWDNCAIILAARSDEVLRPYLSLLLEWLEDLNWPGALIILERLKVFSEVGMLAFCVNERVRIASATNNRSWLRNMSELLENQALAKVLPAACVVELEKHRDT
jgi:hypothetical protein